MSAGDEVLERVREFRIAARTIVEADHFDVSRRCVGLLDLVDMARAETDPAVRTWGERAIWHESKTFLGVDDEQLALPPEGYERRQRRLRQEGFESCPTCFAQIPTERELQRWADMRRAEIERLEARERAAG